MYREAGNDGDEVDEKPFYETIAIVDDEDDTPATFVYFPQGALYRPALSLAFENVPPSAPEDYANLPVNPFLARWRLHMTDYTPSKPASRIVSSPKDQPKTMSFSLGKQSDRRLSPRYFAP